MMKLAALLAYACLAAGCSSPADAQTLRWAARSDTRGMDPSAYVESVTQNLNALVYDGLVERDAQQVMVPALATGWTRSNDDLTWRFTLRPGVKFHDGTPLVAADAVFSIRRAQDASSDFAAFTLPLGTPVEIDAHTIELRLAQPDPLVLERLASVKILSRAWCVEHQLERVPALKARDEAYTARHAMGTGRYLLKERAPGSRTVFVRNPDWWGSFKGNVAEIVYLPIDNDATRIAALLAGDIDFDQDVPPQDVDRIAAAPGMHVVRGDENRIVFLGFDQSRDELQYASVRGKNPFKDVRVREAFAHAIDVQALRATIMRGRSLPTGCFAAAAAGCMDPTLEAAPAADLPRARALMRDAGYGEGFALTLDCPNDRYQNDRAICVALGSMLARIGVALTVEARPSSLHFPKLRGYDTSFYMLGWANPELDAQSALDAIAHGPDPARRKGELNSGRYADAELDRLIDAAAVEARPTVRAGMLAAAQRRIAADYRYLILHRQMLVWAARANVHPILTADNLVRADWIRIDRAP